jgi:hypothetical protein
VFMEQLSGSHFFTFFQKKGMVTSIQIIEKSDSSEILRPLVGFLSSRR